MTIDEAIERLKTDIYKYADFTENPNENEFWMAFDMAIKALELQPEDAISRQAAIDIVRHECGEWKGLAKEIVKQFNGLPSIQPKQIECEDAISREDALKALAYDIESFEFKSGVSRHMNEIANLLNTIYEIQSDNIKALPSVQPKYNTSEWCHDCKEYDQEKHCCPRFNNVIRKTVEEIKQSKTGHCKDCKYFEYDHFENMGGIPLITTHKVCKRHGLICKTDEDGYCHLWEHKAGSEES